MTKSVNQLNTLLILWDNIMINFTLKYTGSNYKFDTLLRFDHHFLLPIIFLLLIMPQTRYYNITQALRAVHFIFKNCLIIISLLATESNLDIRES